MDKKYEKYWDLIVWSIHGEATPEQEEDLRCWRDADPKHEHFFQQTEYLLKNMRSSSETPVFDEEKGWDTFMDCLKQRGVRKSVIRRIGNYAAAVAAVAVIALGAFHLLQPAALPEADILPGSQKAILVLDNGAKIAINNNPMHISRENADIRNDSVSGLSFHIPEGKKEEKITYSKLIIPQGGEYKLTLPDGTKVWLNSESELRFPSRFSKDKRVVEFSGEAYFEVAHQPERPFYVKTADMEVKVYGTEFNLYSYADEKETATTLVKGSVAVIPGQGEEIRITPSQRLSYSRETHEVSVEEVDTRLFTSWKDGFYTFENEPLEVIFNYLKRWYMFEVSYADESLKAMRFTGEFQKDRPIVYGLDLIRMTCEVNFRVEGNHILVIP